MEVFGQPIESRSQKGVTNSRPVIYLGFRYTNMCILFFTHMKAWEEISVAYVVISKAFLLQIQVSLVDVWKLLASVVLDAIYTSINSKWFDTGLKF